MAHYVLVLALGLVSGTLSGIAINRLGDVEAEAFAAMRLGGAPSARFWKITFEQIEHQAGGCCRKPWPRELGGSGALSANSVRSFPSHPHLSASALDPLVVSHYGLGSRGRARIRHLRPVRSVPFSSVVIVLAAEKRGPYPRLLSYATEW